MTSRPVIERAVPLIDFEIERGGDGRTVTAYAATFGDPYEVIDFDGHYDEVIHRSAFDRFLTGGIGRVQVQYDHGRHPMIGRSPVAEVLEVRADARGLVTRSRYLSTAFGEQALTEWRENAIRAQSFRGPIWRSSPRRPGPNGRPIIERTDLGLIEYGPTPFPANDRAELVAIRSIAEMTADERLELLGDLTPEDRAELARLLTLSAPSDDAPGEPAADEASGETDAPEDPGSSIDLLIAEAAQRRRRNL